MREPELATQQPVLEPGAIFHSGEWETDGQEMVAAAGISSAVSAKRTADAMERCATALENIAQALTPDGAAALFEGLEPLVAPHIGGTTTDFEITGVSADIREGI